MDPILLVIIILAIGGFLYYKRQQVIKDQESRPKSELQFQGFDQKKNQPASLIKTIGETNAVCPYCNEELEKMPSRKTKCPHCGNYIFKRTRPYDNANILIREDQIEDMEEQWAIKNGQHDLFLKEKRRKEKIKNRLQEQYGSEPNEEDLEWKVLNEQAFEYEQNGDWGFARNKRLEMAKHLQKHSRPERALKMYCEICYIDSNGPRNTSRLPDGMKGHPFSQSKARLALGIIKRVDKLLKKMNAGKDQLKSIYFESAEETYNRLGGMPPIKPEDAWQELNDELEWISQ